jgi:hypothetical protein
MKQAMAHEMQRTEVLAISIRFSSSQCTVSSKLNTTTAPELRSRPSS